MEKKEDNILAIYQVEVPNVNPTTIHQFVAQ